MTISTNIKEKIYAKTEGVCILCNKSLGNDLSQCSVEHFIPRAIYKWIEEPTLQTQLESIQNLFIVHRHCNLSKDARLPTKASINKLNIGQHIKEELHTLYDCVFPSIIKYEQIKQDTLFAQHHRCAFCEKKIYQQASTLRRKHNNLPRTKSNSMCLCLRCSIRAGNLQYKHHMVNKKEL